MSEPVRVFRTDGTETSSAAALYDIKKYLEAEHEYSEVGSDTVATYARVDLADPRNSAFCAQLSTNSYFSMRRGGGLFVRRQHQLGVTNEKLLRTLFLVDIPSGRLSTSAGLRREGVGECELAGAYDGVEVDLDAMIRRREVCSVQDAVTKEVTFFPRPVGCAADPFLRDLWNSVKMNT